MKVGNYYVTWQYFNTEKVDKKNRTTHHVCTKCILFKDDKPVNDGVAVCGVKDRDDRDKGRKVALKKAINYLHKTERTEFWEIYRTMTKTPRW